MTIRKIIPTKYIPQLRWKLLSQGISKLPPDITSPLEEEDKLRPEELVELLNSRFKSGYRDTISATFGDPDFLPFPFLAKGIKCGAAVCRLVRIIKDLYALIEQIYQAEADFNERFSVEDLTRIFGIEEKDKMKLFKDFQDHPSEALTRNKEILKESMRYVELEQKMPVIPFGTGFLVGNNFLLTNHHVLETKSEVENFIAEFGYEQDILGRNIEPILYQLDSSLFYTNEKLDYTLVKVKKDCMDGGLKGYAGEYFGYLKMLADPKVIAPGISKDKAVNDGIFERLSPQLRERIERPSFLGDSYSLPGEPVNIIQHPKGKRKEIVLSNNRVQEVSQNFLYYEADTDFSSSGSPVLNQQWQLVGLHHAAVAREDTEGKTRKWRIVGQEGVRICCILHDLYTTIDDMENKAKKIEASMIALQEAKELKKELRYVENLHSLQIEDSLNPAAQHGKVEPLVSEETREFIRDLRFSDPAERSAKIQEYKRVLINKINNQNGQYEQFLKEAGETSVEVNAIEVLEEDKLRNKINEWQKKVRELREEFIKPFVEAYDNNQNSQLPVDVASPYSS